MLFDHVQRGGSSVPEAWQELRDLEDKLNCKIRPGKNLKILKEYKHDN